MAGKEESWISVGIGLGVASLATLGTLVSPPWDFLVEVGCLGTSVVIVVTGGLRRKPALAVDEWAPEVEEFRDAAASLWATLVPLFEQHGFFGLGSARPGLQDLVRAAPWPDDKAEPENTSALFREALSEFCGRVCTKSGEQVFSDAKEFFAFDATRRRLTNTLRKWSKRVDIRGFLDWLRDADRLNWPRRGASGEPSPPLHAHTLKLVWYLERAVVADSKNDDASYVFLSTLRDRLSAPSPMMVTGDEDGYLTLAPPGV